MGNLFLIIGIIETIFVFLFGNNNASEILNLSFMNFSFSINFLIACILIYVLGIVAGIFIMLKGFYVGSKKMNSAKRMLEKKSVDADDSELKIRALENKIQTLEVALDKALNKNN